MVGKDEGKARFLLESVPCGGSLSPQQRLKALGVHGNCPQTFRREPGEFHKNYPESLDFNLSITSDYNLFARHVLPSHRATHSCLSPLLRKSLLKPQSPSWSPLPRRGPRRMPVLASQLFSPSSLCRISAPLAKHSQGCPCLYLSWYLLQHLVPCGLFFLSS